MAANDPAASPSTDFSPLRRPWPVGCSLLITHAKGRADKQASELLRQAVSAVAELGRTATVTVQFTISPGKNNPEVVNIGDKVTAKIPQERRDSIWYIDTDGGLHRNSVTQMDLYDNA